MTYPKNLREDEFRHSFHHPTEVRLGSVEIYVKKGRLLAYVTRDEFLIQTVDLTARTAKQMPSRSGYCRDDGK